MESTGNLTVTGEIPSDDPTPRTYSTKHGTTATEGNPMNTQILPQQPEPTTWPLAPAVLVGDPRRGFG